MSNINAARLLLKASLVTFALASTGMANATGSTDVTLEIINIESGEGNMNIAVYDNEASLKKSSTYRAIRQPAVKGKMEILLKDMPAGEFGVMLFQDLNGNNELDTNLLGIPTEPWSASLLGRSVFGAPGWSDINFKLPDAGGRISIDMK